MNFGSNYLIQKLLGLEYSWTLNKILFQSILGHFFGLIQK